MFKETPDEDIYTVKGTFASVTVKIDCECPYCGKFHSGMITRLNAVVKKQDIYCEECNQKFYIENYEE